MFALSCCVSQYQQSGTRSASVFVRIYDYKVNVISPGRTKYELGTNAQWCPDYTKYEKRISLSQDFRSNV